MTAQTPARLALIDQCRGGALLAMAVFHLIWDLIYFGWLPQNIARATLFHGLGHIIAAVFLFLAGVSLVLAHETQINWRAFSKRLGLIAAGALTITVVTWRLMPEGIILFGILHCLAIGSLIAMALLRAPLGVLAFAAVLALCLPLWIAEPVLNARFVQWLGLGTFEPASYDWRPLFPWCGLILVGALSARLMRTTPAHVLASAIQQWRAPKMFDRIDFLGRHGLAFYLIHQPILFAAVFVITTLFAPPKDDESGYMAACQQQCEARGGAQDFCQKMCGCVARGLKKSELWEQGLSGTYTPRQKQEMEQIAQMCARTE